MVQRLFVSCRDRRQTAWVEESSLSELGFHFHERMLYFLEGNSEASLFTSTTWLGGSLPNLLCLVRVCVRTRFLTRTCIALKKEQTEVENMLDVRNYDMRWGWTGFPHSLKRRCRTGSLVVGRDRAISWYSGKRKNKRQRKQKIKGRGG